MSADGIYVDPHKVKAVANWEQPTTVTEVRSCNTPKYTLVVFDMFRVFCKHNLTVS